MQNESEIKSEYAVCVDTSEPVLAGVPKSARAVREGWARSAIIVAICTAIAVFAFRYLELVDIAMLYLLGVMLAASRATQWPALLAALLSVAAFDFFFVPPRFTFEVGDTRHFVTFTVMFFVALVISRLTLRIRQQADDAQLREQRTSALYDLNRKLVRERDRERIVSIAEQHIGAIFNSRVVILLPDSRGDLTPPGGDFPWSETERDAAQWVLANRQPAGRNALTGLDAKALYLPLMASTGSVGVVGLSPLDPEARLDPGQLAFLEAFIGQTGIAVERALLAEESHRTSMKAETESLRNTLLSSISHDLRTPLTTVTGAVSTLLSADDALDRQSQKELLETVQEEAARLSKIIKNVLAMTRLEAGGIALRKEWQSLEEIVGVVLSRMGDRLHDRPVTISLPPDLPLIPFDGLLLEQVLMNLIENAVKYTPGGTQLFISASADALAVTFELADGGPGIPPGDEERIFDKFYRAESAGGGVGLGLAICRAIISAHGGRIWAENRRESGAVLRFTLPAEGEPKLEKEREETA